MTANDHIYLERNCPDVFLALLSLRMLLKRIDQREETEDLLQRTGSTVKDGQSLEVAKGRELLARKAGHEMLRRLGPLPELDEDLQFVASAPRIQPNSRRGISTERKPRTTAKQVLSVPTNTNANVTEAAKLLGARG